MNSAPDSEWQQANQYLLQGNYARAADLYEQAIAAEPEEKSHYWQLGLMLLLQGQEAEAQTTWLLGMAEGESEEIEQWIAQLIQVLQTEASRQAELGAYQIAWAIRQHIQEIAPADVNNLLHIIALSIQLETFTGEDLTASGIIELLQAEESAVDDKLLLLVLQEVLNYAPEEPAVLTFTQACLHHAQPPQAFIHVVMLASIKLDYSANNSALAALFAELCWEREPNNTEVLNNLTLFYQNSRQYYKGITSAKLSYEKATSLVEKIYRNYLLIRALMSASGHWQSACSALEEQKELILYIIKQLSKEIEEAADIYLYNTAFFFPYVTDAPSQNRFLQNQVARISYENTQKFSKELVENYSYTSSDTRNITANKKILRIGYISHCLRRHSIGWIARWLLHHHDRERFQVYAYLVGQLASDRFAQQWIVNNTYRSYIIEPNREILKQIQSDEIDILIDLDSITLDIHCGIFSIKPAPIQVSWLGWDASGLPAIDYFIADPYVLPEAAQEYYTEKIWRLPNTYVAVDGFEVGVPTLRREQLDIPSDAVIYFVTQGGYKRHPDNVRLQMRILKEVPNSYLLIKGLADEESSKAFFAEVAEEVGLSGERLRFLPIDPSSEIHRANLGIADVVLDTYPYNGATTTLETLWMGIPLVTRVGQQFAARNSYTMMMNVGVTEGIAWSDDEYLEWGVRLGKDEALRQQVAWKLKASRQTAPLWNAKQFTREMEAAYSQMWARYVEANQ